MLKANRLFKACITLLFSILILSVNSAEKIKDLKAHLASDEAYKKASTITKFSIISKLCQENKASSYDDKTREIVNALALEFMSEKGKNDPLARLKAFSQLQNLNARDKPLYMLNLDDKVCSLDFITYLSSSSEYQNGTTAKKKEILEKLIKDKTWARVYGEHEATKVGIAFIEESTAGMKAVEKARKSLEILSQMKESNLIRWGGSYSGLEEVFLNTYLSNNEAYKKMSPKEKTKHLEELEKKGLIMSFIQSDMESVIIAEQLAKDPAFIKLSIEQKQAKIEKMSKAREIHTFSGRKILNLLGLPEKR